MANRTSMDDIARKLGISKNTVSLAMRGMPGLSADTREAVLRTARAMGYEYRKGVGAAGQRPGADDGTHDAGRPLSRGICILLPETSHDAQGFFTGIQHGIEQEANRNHYHTFIHSYDEQDPTFRLPLCIRDGLVSGIISIGRVSARTAECLAATGLPYVMADHYLDNGTYDSVLTDNIQAADTATAWLIERGHTRIGFIGDVWATVCFRDRYTGFRNAMTRHCLPVDETLCVLREGMDSTVRETDQLGETDIAGITALPTAFLCANDATALILYRVLGQMGISVPDQVSLIGFDDVSASAFVTPGLTTMRVHKEWMGRKAFRRICEKLTDGDEVPQRILLSSVLVERGSVCRLPKG